MTWVPVPFTARELHPVAIAGHAPLINLMEAAAMRTLDEMEITAKRVDVLAKLRVNRELHAKVVIEARAGYLRRAQAALEERLAKTKEGKLVSLGFRLQLPQDYTSVYDTAITMMELHTGDEIKLSAGQVRSLMRDEWDWSHTFYSTNAEYSGTAAEKLSGGEP